MNHDELLKMLFGTAPAITPEDMCAKQFPKRLAGGYNPKEVDEYLRRSADLVESLLNRIRKMLQERDEQERRLAEYRRHEQRLHEALASSQKYAEDTVETARNKAEAMTVEARLHKERLLLEAERLPEALLADIRRLKEQRQKIRDDLTHIIEVHAALLERMPLAVVENLPPESPFELEPRDSEGREHSGNKEEPNA